METCKAEKYPVIRKTDTDQLIAQMTVNDAPRRRFPHFLFKLKTAVSTPTRCHFVFGASSETVLKGTWKFLVYIENFSINSKLNK